MAEFGPGVYGAGAASQRYFGKAAADLEPRGGGRARRGPAHAARLASRGDVVRAINAESLSILNRMDKAAFLARQI